MHRWTRKLWLALMPALILSVSLLGCSGSDKDKKTDNKAKKQDGKENTDGSEDKGGEKKPVKGKGTASITGVVTYDGDMDDLTKEIKKLDATLLDQMNKLTDQKDMCLAKTATDREKTEFQWRVNKDNKGVKNVFVWIRPATDNEYFDVSDLVKEDKGFEKEVKLDQPHCAFTPHAFTLFQRYVDPKNPDKLAIKQPKTGQKFVVVNSATKPHNTKWEGKGTIKGGNEKISPNEPLPIDDFKASYEGPVNFACSIHPWMRAYAWSFDHPFAAVTDKDGKYEIKGVPAGVKVRIVAWHEEAGFNKGGSKGQLLEVPAAGGKQDFTVKK